MSWSAITEAKLLTQISGDELEALRAAALADGQDDPVDPSIEQVTDEVRGYVAGCRSNTLDDDATKIPDRLMRAAVIMVIVEIIGRVPGYEVEEKRQKRYDQALSLMRLVANCKYPIEDASTGSDVTPSPSFTERTRNFERSDQEGI